MEEIRKIELSEDHIKTYEDKGYIVFPDVVSDALCDRLIAESERVADGDYRSYLTMHKESELFLETLRHPAILGIVDQIQNHRMIPIGSVYFFCKPGNPNERGSLWHQDNYAAKAPEGSYLVCAIALDDADAANGSLVVFPGTHKLGDLPNSPSPNFGTDENGKTVQYPVGNYTEVPEGYPSLQLEYSKGSVLLMHALLLHGAPANPHPERWRRKFYMHYIKDGHPFWPGWMARRQLIDRGDHEAANHC